MTQTPTSTLQSSRHTNEDVTCNGKKRPEPDPEICRLCLRPWFGRRPHGRQRVTITAKSTCPKTALKRSSPARTTRRVGSILFQQAMQGRCQEHKTPALPLTVWPLRPCWGYKKERKKEKKRIRLGIKKRERERKKKKKTTVNGPRYIEEKFCCKTVFLPGGWACHTVYIHTVA